MCEEVASHDTSSRWFLGATSVGSEYLCVVCVTSENVGALAAETTDTDGDFTDIVAGTSYDCVGVDTVVYTSVVGHCCTGPTGIYTFEDYCVCKCSVGPECASLDVGALSVVCEHH